MRALTLTRPWPYVVLHLGKRIENRSRRDGRDPKALTRYRGRLYLHAAKSFDPAVGDSLRDQGLIRAPTEYWLRDERVHPPQAIVGSCDVVGRIAPSPDGPRLYEAEGFDLRWWMGDHGLLLDNVRPLLQPVPCRGHQGIWTVPPSVQERVRQVEAA